MHYLTILILGTAAGIAGYAGMIHAFIGVARRPHDLTHLLFALLSLAVAAHTLAVVVMQTSTSLIDYLFIHKYFFGPTALAVFVCFMWFVACYTTVWPRRFLAAMSLWIALTIALHVLLPFGILYTHISGLNQISLAWGEQIVSARGTPNPLRLSFDLFNLVLFIFCFYALVQQYRAGNRRRALMLGLALGVFLLSRVVDSLIGLGVINSMRVSEVAFVGIVVTMSLTLSYEVTQTEQLLHRHQEHLHELVAARTAELTQTNLQLAQEIRERTLIDAARARLYQRALVDRERLTVLYQAAQAISRASLDPQQLYGEIHCALSRLMPVERLVIAMYDEATQAVDYVYLADATSRLLGGRVPHANVAAGDLLLGEASVRIDDFSTLPQLKAPFAPFGDLPDTASGVAALLRGSEHELGMLFVQSDTKGAYTDEDEELLQLLAAHAAIALENAYHYAQARDLATREERTRLARELHDSVTQNLYAATLVIETVPVIWSRNAAEGALNLAKVRQLVRGALAEMRTLLFELRPAALAAAELATLLRQLGEVLTGHTRIPVEVRVEGQISLPVDVKIAIYRIAQEAFNNIAKHAGATQVRVVLRAMSGGGVLLAVRDDGRGFDLGSTPADRMGLRIMAERSSGIGAQLWVNSAPQCGTEVAVQWPEQPLAVGAQAGRWEEPFQEAFWVQA
jgi:signal transduction histidine kinase